MEDLSAKKSKEESAALEKWRKDYLINYTCNADADDNICLQTQTHEEICAHKARAKRPRLSKEERSAREEEDRKKRFLNYTWSTEYNVSLYELTPFLDKREKKEDFDVYGVSLMKMLKFNQENLHSFGNVLGDCIFNKEGVFYSTHLQERLSSKDPNYNIRLRDTNGYFTHAIPLTMDNIWEYGYAPVTRAMAQLLVDAKDKNKKDRENTKATALVSEGDMNRHDLALLNEVTEKMKSRLFNEINGCVIYIKNTMNYFY